jgi:hypothetical protein
MNIGSSRRRLLFVLSLTFTICSLTIAQDLDTFSISGRILDQNMAAIPGALIQLTSLRSNATRTVNCDSEGRYRLVQLEPGNYKLVVSVSGFAPQQLEQINGISGQSLSLDVRLEPATVNANTVVIGSHDEPVIDTKRTVIGATLTARETENLPMVNRSPFDLVFILPGVTEEPLSTRDLAEDRNASHNSTPEEAGTFSLNGAPAYSNNLTIDGLDNNDDRSARERFQPSIEALEEVQVITNQFSAEYGRASGGRVNLRTRSGSNTFHGRLLYFFRDEALNANSFRNNTLGLSRLPLQEHDVGFTFSGPVPRLRTRATFFTSVERNMTLDSTLIDTLVPVNAHPLFPLPAPTILLGKRLELTQAPALPTEVAPFISTVSTPSRNTSTLMRVDYKFSDLHNATVVWQSGRLMNLRQFGGGNRLADGLQGKRRNSDAVSISDNYVISGNAVNQLRFQFSRLAPAFAATGVSPVVLITLNDPLDDEDLARRSGTLVAGSSTSGGSERREARFQVQNIFSMVSGNHSLKFGGDIHRVDSDFIDLADTTGTFNFASAGDFLAGIPTRFRQTFHPTSTQRNTYLGFFVQDEWQVVPQLLFSYGLRYERETILADRNNFGPRFALAYSPLESGRLVLRFGGGIFYNRALLRTIDDFTLGTQQLFFDTNSLRDPTTGKLLSTEQRHGFIAANLRFPNTLTTDSYLVRQFGMTNHQFTRRLDPLLRIPETYQLNCGIERDLGNGYSVEANFTYTRGLHLWREFNQNSPRLPDGYQNFTEFLASRDFANFFNPDTESRRLYQAANAGELVRFFFGNSKSPTANNIARIVEFGVPVSLINLNSLTSSTALEVALAALNDLRPDPGSSEIEQLVSAGSSFYRGLTVELRKRVLNANSNGLSVMFRAGYTWSSLIDDGVVNTSDALTPGDFRHERARSLLDRQHRFVFSGTVGLPAWLGSLQLSPFLRIASSAPFNISLGGVDRNLDDVSNDRPNFSGDVRALRWLAPGQTVDPAVVEQFSLPAIGTVGNLPRNAGRGPGLFALDLNAMREFRFGERGKLRASVEFDNVMNKTVFSFGSEFINFNALSTTATGEQRQSFLDSFLVTTRTMRPRQVRVGLRLEF